ncbi:MAG: ABC transporter ATP-binding protein [Steroidobacteraceae bacterium]
MDRDEALPLNAGAPIDDRDVLACERLTVAVPGRVLVRDLDVGFRPGRVIALLGRNGAGKSSLLHVLAGLRPAAGGRVRWRDRPLEEWPRRELALALGFLAQASEDPFPGTVLETALVGRHPHIGTWRWESDDDRAIARRCLAAVDLSGVDGRDVESLSGGERRRLAIATVLAQAPRIHLLDEPVQQLDPLHQLEVLRLFRARADAGDCVVMSLHDPGVAAIYADECLLLHGDGRWRHGPTDRVLDEASIGELYGVRVRELRWDGGRTFVPA